ncbi:MAG TPA: lamin tail domain-containing protein, partial [Verrucomicrobiae bacterium]|nr:lamin tail domain-containing protein [Verrucomicrobiae bacterium]
STAPVQFISNGNFETGLTGWRILGDHNHSRVEVDPDNPANHVLHIIATGPQEHMHNHIETTYAGGHTVVIGREYQISFRAKWLTGNNLLNTRLYFDRVPRTSVLQMPALNGTPGAQNSRFGGNIGPTFSGFGHQPVIPQSGQAVTVSVVAQDPQGVSSCQVWWSANGGSWNSAAMTGDTNGLYTGAIPGLGSGTIVQFYVRAVDGLGAASTYPAGGTNSGALYTVNDGQANLPLAHNVRIILTPGNTALLHAFTNVMSNDNLPCTVIYDEKRAYYDMGVRLKGSERGRYSDTRVSFHLEFQPDDLFRGVHPVMLIDRSGAGDSSANKQEEIVVRHILLHAGNIPGTQPDLCRVIAPMSVHTGPAIFSPRHEDEFIQTAYGSSGTLYELELIYYPTTADAGGYKNPQPDNVVGYDISDLGNDKELYRYDFIIKNHRDADDYGPMMALGKAFSLAAGPALDAQTAQVMDLDEWLRAFAVVSLCSIGDSYTFGNNHNLLMYQRPADGKMLAFPWDMDFSFNRGTTASLVGDQNFGKIINRPANLRRFYAHMLDIIGSTYNTSYVTYWANHYAKFCPGQDFSVAITYARDRSAYAISTINSAGGNSPFAVNGNSTITVSNNLIVFTGTAPATATRIKVNGIEYPITWTSLSAWSMAVPVSDASSTLVFQGYDLYGNAVPSYTANVNVTYSGPSVDPKNALVINEIMYHPAVSNASYVEIFNNSPTVSFDLSNWRLHGVDYNFPEGTIITNKQFLVIAKSRSAVVATYSISFSIPVFGEFDGNLDPDGETLALIKPGATPDQDQIIDIVRYEAAAPWPAGANGSGASLELIDANQDNSRVSNWSDGSGWRFYSFTGVPGAGATSFTITMDSAGDFYIDDIMLVAGSVPGVGDNLLQNGGFESGLLGPWTASGNHSGSAVSSAVKFSGNASLHVVATGPGSAPSSAITQAVANVVSSNPYTISFWYLPSSNANGFNYRLTSTLRSLSSINLRPTFATPGAANSVTALLEPYPLLWINEVLPNNVSGITDGFGEHDPWLELYNSGTNAITLDGYALGNNYSNVAQWPFPNGTIINPGEFKVIFADGQPSQTLPNELHTSFRLDPTNGAIVLSKTGRILDYINYSDMDANFSYGSLPDAQVVARQRFFYTTPGAPNNGSPVPVIINEWLASNTNNLVDPATGKYEDWFELYNFGPVAIDLSGFYLTDDLGKKKQWALPAGTIIGPGAYLLVWADNAATNSTPADLHANFQLSKNGEQIGLFTPDGLTVDAVTFGP